MKRFFLFTALLVLITSCASQQTVDKADMKYQEIVQLPGQNKSQIYESALRGLAIIFNNSKAVIQYQNKDEGLIIGKGIADVTYLMTFPTYFTITIEIKDEKMRITFTDLSIEIRTSGITTKSPLENQAQLESFTEKAKEIVKEISQNMNKSNNDW